MVPSSVRGAGIPAHGTVLSRGATVALSSAPTRGTVLGVVTKTQNEERTGVTAALCEKRGGRQIHFELTQPTS